MSLNTNFVHLRLHSEYSIVDGAVRIDDAITAVVKDQMGALALTDLSNVFGLVKFYQAARKEGIKPIIGSDVWITNAADRDKPFRLQLLVKNHQGYLNLCELLTKASLTNQFKGRSEIDETWFKQHAEGLIALSGARLGDVDSICWQVSMLKLWSVPKSGQITLKILFILRFSVPVILRMRLIFMKPFIWPMNFNYRWWQRIQYSS